MNTPGFWLTSLRLTGPDVEDAEVGFEKGLNVICGPSDTGKTFILQCIDFILGGQDNPKDIPEADGYDTVFLEIRAYETDKLITLRRSLQGGSIEITEEGGSPFVVKSKHGKDCTDTVSYILLKLSGLENKRLKKNKDGVTQELSFRNIAKFCVISERDVQKDSSPILTGQYTSKTSELALFKLLMTGVDDSSVVAVESKKISKVRIESKNEILQEIIAKTEKEYKELNVPGSYEELQAQFVALEESYASVTAALKAAQDSVSGMEVRRKQAWVQLRQIDSRLGVLNELRTRFGILEKQYNSDIRRLEAVAETGGRLFEMTLEHCYVCGSPAEHHNSLHQNALMNLETVSRSCLVEAEKLRALLADLKIAQAEIQNEIIEKRESKMSLEFGLKSITSDIESNLKPKLSRIVSDYRERQKKKESVGKALDILKRLSEFGGLVEEVAKSGQDVEQVSSDNIITASALEAFSLAVEERLKAWNFPNAGRVTFSETDWDVVIGGRRRASHGKGVRAITHAAFSLALLNLCWQKKTPYPNFLVIDSPLVVYKEPDPDEQNFSVDVKGRFYTDIAKSFRDVQVIILENNDPPSQLVESGDMNLIAFTKTNRGRYGFIPLR